MFFVFFAEPTSCFPVFIRDKRAVSFITSPTESRCGRCEEEAASLVTLQCDNTRPAQQPPALTLPW